MSNAKNNYEMTKTEIYTALENLETELRNADLPCNEYGVCEDLEAMKVFRDKETILQAKLDALNAPTFEVGQDYEMGWIGDSELKTVYKVVKRTNKFVTLLQKGHYAGKEVRCKVKTYQGEEFCYPTGKYSMAPSLYAGKKMDLEAVNVDYKGFTIVNSNYIVGWFMTVCGQVVGESINEVMGDIDRTAKAQEWEQNNPMEAAHAAKRGFMRIV